jgi:hypothetical protein
MKKPYVIVLAGNTREGRRYAKLAGLPKGGHRVVFSAKQIRRLRSAEIHELPSFRRRPDRHGINAALRYTRGERKLVEMPTEQMSPYGDNVQMSPYDDISPRQFEAAYRYNALRDTPALDAVAELAKAAEEAAELDKIEDQGDGLGPQLDIDGDEHPVEPKPRKRRSRCKVCAQLVFGDDDPDHDAGAHEAVDAKVLGKPAPTLAAASFFGGKVD